MKTNAQQSQAVSSFNLFCNLFSTILPLVLLFIGSSCNQKNEKHKAPVQELLDVDFDRSMGGKSCPEYRALLAHNGAELLQFKRVYLQNKPSRIALHNEGKIPRIIHQIWLGTKPVPLHLEELSKSFRKLHPDWEYHLWTDEKIAALDFDLRSLFQSYTEGSDTPKKLDILRAEVLDHFGGVVVDLDFEARQALDSVHAKYDFYTALAIPQNEHETPLPSKVVGARRGHPIIKEWKRELVLLQSGAFQNAISKKVGQSADQNKDVNIVFPASYFYPISSFELTSSLKHKPSKMKKWIQAFLEFLHIKSKVPFSEAKPETLAICCWGANMLKTKEQSYYELYQELQCQQKELSKEIGELKDEIQKLKTYLNG